MALAQQRLGQPGLHPQRGLNRLAVGAVRKGGVGVPNPSYTVSIKNKEIIP
jgi:hypothetical protein